MSTVHMQMVSYIKHFFKHILLQVISIYHYTTIYIGYYIRTKKNEKNFKKFKEI